MRRRCSRRSVLRASAVGGACALAGGPFVGTAAGTPTGADDGAGSGTGKLVFTYDDGPIEDYTKAFPVHQEEGVPACIGAISNRLGHSEHWLDAETLHEITAAGWEVIDHTFRHRALDEVPLTADVAPEDEKIYVRSNVHSREPADLLLSDGEHSTVVTIAGGGEDDDGQFVELEAPVGESFAAATTTERYTDEVLRKEIVQSKADLEALGFSVSGFMLPYGRYGERSMELIGQHHDAVVNYQRGGLNYVGEFDPLRMSRRYVGEGSLDELGRYMDEVARGGAIGILGAHARDDSLTADRIRAAIRMAKERDVEIVTLREALVDAGVVAGDRPTATPTARDSGGSSRTTTPTERPERTDARDDGGGFFDALRRLFGSLIEGLLGVL